MTSENESKCGPAARMSKQLLNPKKPKSTPSLWIEGFVCLVQSETKEKRDGGPGRARSARAVRHTCADTGTWPTTDAKGYIFEGSIKGSPAP